MVSAKFSQIDSREKDITDCKFTNEEINTLSRFTDSFTDCEFHDIPKFGSQGTLVFRRCEFFFSSSSKTKFIGSQSHILFEDCTFHKGSTVFFDNFNDIDFFNCSSSIRLLFKTVKSTQFMKCGVGKNGSISTLQFDDSKLTNFYADCSVIDSITLLKSFNGLFKVNGGDIGQIKFNTIQEKAKIDLSAHNFFDHDLQIWSLTINDTFFSGRLNLKYLDIEVIEFPNLSPIDNRKVLFHKVKVLRSLNLSNSFLDGFTFNDVDLETADLKLGGSFMRNTIFSNIKWPKGYIVAEELPKNASPTDITKYYARLKEVYQQLKNKSFVDNNRLDAMKFYRNEMDAYFQKIKKDKTESPWSKLLLRVDKLVSDFGQRYMRPFIILIVFHLLVSFLIWYLQAGSISQLLSSSLNEGIWDYFYRLNPVHRPMDDWSKTINGIDALSRLINGFFIYHFIKAIRRFSKVG